MNTIADFRNEQLSFIIEKVNGIPLANEQDLTFDTYYINIKLDIQHDWKDMCEFSVYQYITDDVKIIDYWYSDDLTSFFDDI